MDSRRGQRKRTPLREGAADWVSVRATEEGTHGNATVRGLPLKHLLGKSMGQRTNTP